MFIILMAPAEEERRGEKKRREKNGRPIQSAIIHRHLRLLFLLLPRVQESVPNERGRKSFFSSSEKRRKNIPFMEGTKECTERERRR